MRRLIEEAFPLKKVSENSKHEKSAGRKGHISTLHIWPARRPLAASRAAFIAALLPDPADAPPEVRREYERLAEFAADLNAVRTGEAPEVYRAAEGTACAPPAPPRVSSHHTRRLPPFLGFR